MLLAAETWPLTPQPCSVVDLSMLDIIATTLHLMQNDVSSPQILSVRTSKPILSEAANLPKNKWEHIMGVGIAEFRVVTSCSTAGSPVPIDSSAPQTNSSR
ncbi:hypothetical protein LshimejAT787_1500630 [Lyophyllum shimeji]|uniref:Uncharacterized protein n=1 Tax=Lyophyllum shimeji TaxID=47721 RepID=A0A9P3PYE5_LYOSH|nr:hypothetical protein LshimejAT787_1500630 [Lyophyllum shimeji]